jgi:serine/threonine-protein kinase RIM15
VFANILAGQVEYHEDEIEYSEEARDFMKRLLVQDPAQRLGSNGADEIKAHPWFADIEWDTITSKEAAFIPQVTDLESTEYFNARGAVPINFQDDEPHVALRHPADSPGLSPDPASAGAQAASAPVAGPASSLFANVGDENFGSFSYKNVPVLKQANDEILKQMRTDQMLPLMHTLSEPSTATSSAHNRRRSVSARIKKPPSVVTSFDPKNMPTGPPSPATSTSSVASSPSRNSMTPSTPGSAGHARKGSEMGVGAVDRFRVTHSEDGTAGPRRTMSGPSRLRTASVSTGHSDDGSGSDVNSGSQGDREVHTPPSSVASLEFGARHDRGSELARAERSSDSGAGKADRAHESMGPPPKPDMMRKTNQVDLRKQPDPHDRAVTCLLAEDNPITAKIIETLLIRLGCRCVVVADGSEAISVALGDIRMLYASY